MITYEDHSFCEIINVQIYEAITSRSSFKLSTSDMEITSGYRVYQTIKASSVTPRYFLYDQSEVKSPLPFVFTRYISQKLYSQRTKMQAVSTKASRDRFELKYMTRDSPTQPRICRKYAD